MAQSGSPPAGTCRLRSRGASPTVLVRNSSSRWQPLAWQQDRFKRAFRGFQSWLGLRFSQRWKRCSKPSGSGSRYGCLLSSGRALRRGSLPQDRCNGRGDDHRRQRGTGRCGSRPNRCRRPLEFDRHRRWTRVFVRRRACMGKKPERRRTGHRTPDGDPGSRRASRPWHPSPRAKSYGSWCARSRGPIFLPGSGSTFPTGQVPHPFRAATFLPCVRA